MSQYTEFGHKAFNINNSSGIAQYLRVKGVSSGGNVLIDVAGVTDAELGVVTRASFDNTHGPQDVKLRTAPGTVQMVASGAISLLGNVYTAANGKVAGTQATGALLLGIALTAATANGDVIEVLRRSYEA